MKDWNYMRRIQNSFPAVYNELCEVANKGEVNFNDLVSRYEDYLDNLCEAEQKTIDELSDR